MTDVLAPCAGRVMGMADVPDPVFAGEMVGPGVAIDPLEGASGRQTVLSPIGGKLVKVHPHAFVVLGANAEGKPLGVLVHLGIDTVKLEGRGFEVLVRQGDTVAAGDPVVTWDPATIEAPMSPVVPVVVMDAPKGSVTSALVGSSAGAGEVLFSL